MIWLLNRPEVARKSIALVLLCGCALIVAGLVAGTASWLRSGHEQIEEKRILLGRLNDMVSDMSVRIDSTAPGSDEPPTLFLSGQSDTVIRAGLQQTFKSLAARHRVSVGSVGNAPDFDKDDVTYAGLQANISGTIDNLQQFLFGLETLTPVLFITELTMRSTENPTQRRPRAEPALVVQMRLYGALMPADAQAILTGQAE